MSTSESLHVHMGCGESLQSRWWIPKPGKALSVSEHTGKSKRARTQIKDARSGDKCRS